MNRLDSLKEWISLQDSAQISPDTELYKEFGNFFTYLFNNNQDGISLLDPLLNIICVNNTMNNWYGYKTPFSGKKCYEVYHCRTTPCDNCPSLITLKTKKSVSLLVPYETKYAHNGNQKLTTFPVFNEKNEVIAVIEHIRDLSSAEKEKKALIKLNSMLDDQSQKMMEQNIAIRVLGTQLSHDSDEVLSEISMKIDSLILPLLDSIRSSENPEKRDSGLALLEQHIRELTKSYLSKLPLDKLNLSPREVQLATYIREGYTSKEISEILFIAKKTVDFHRANLRKKLGVEGKKSLQTYLLNIGTG
jgi:DNA-binding CsgD family transcriptional regulator